MRSMSIAVKRESAAAGLSVQRLYLLVNRIAELDQGARGDAVRMFTSRKGCVVNNLVFAWMEKFWRGAELKVRTRGRLSVA